MANTTGKLAINKINNKLFVIPYYQRGYRWREKNVIKLLEDLYSFYNTELEYCLQPIVLQEIKDDEYKSINKNGYDVCRVVDGQQRLTTIALIIDKLGIPKHWDIYYDTEKNLLSKLVKENNDTESINTCFRKEVSKAIDSWFTEQKKDVLQKLFTSEEQSIVFLEYDIHSNAKSIEESKRDGHQAFLRLNDGKTPLTSSELIRAMYMVNNSGLDEHQKMEISKEWEFIEDTLRDDKFWMMFNAQGLEDTPTRIDLLFALVLDTNLKEAKANPRIVFEKLDDNNFNLTQVWHSVLQIFWWMQSCYNDIELYNYLCWIKQFTDYSVTSIYDNWKRFPKPEDFKKIIISIIQNSKYLNTEITDLSQVSFNDYSWKKSELRKLFVLLNVLDCNRCKERFRFDLYNNCKGWDIEHIDSQTPNDLNDDSTKREWLSSTWKELSTEQKLAFEQKFGISYFQPNEADLNLFKDYAAYIVELTQGTGDEKIEDSMKDKLGNLALLNLSLNRSYKNDIFPIKREKLISYVNGQTEFVPPCTIKAFTKFYTKKATRITTWQKSDFDDYFNAMNDLYRNFKRIDSSVSSKSKSIPDVLKKNILINNDFQQSENNQPNIHANRFHETISFTTFMNQYAVIVPKIQRTYVQGRLDKRGKKCLAGFANNLVESIINKTPLLLDFVYGIDYGGITSKFYPIDGQQRLTTLLLLAWLCGKINKSWVFRYESRRAIETFVKSMLANDPPALIVPKNNQEEKANSKNGYSPLCSKYIQEQDWFHQAWLSDPGISGMLEMLDSLYDKLICRNTDINDLSLDNIVFLVNYLDVNTKSYDHIYLKMNSRGKELTEWDNVNAILDEFLVGDQKDSKWREKMFSWYELMWKYIPQKGQSQTDKIDTVDEQMIFIVDLALECAGFEGKSTETFELSKWLGDENNFERVNKFYNICAVFFSCLEDISEDLRYALTPAWTQSHTPRIPYFAAEDNNKTIKIYQPLLVYYAAKISTVNIETPLNKDWIRVVWNLTENIDLDKSSFKQAFNLIESLSQHSNTILHYLSNLDNDFINTLKYKKAEKQLKEEIEKAKQILNEGHSGLRMYDATKTWEDIIKSAESTAFFNGMIRFLYTDAEGNTCWNKDIFVDKLKNCSVIFNEDGLTDAYANDYKANKILISQCDRWNCIESNNAYLFGKSKDTWKYKILSNNLTYAKPIHCLLSRYDAKTSEDFIKSNTAELDIFRQQAIHILLDSNLLNQLGYEQTENAYAIWNYNKFILRNNYYYRDCKVLSDTPQRIKILKHGSDDSLIIEYKRELNEEGKYDNKPIILSSRGKELYKFYWWNRPNFNDEWIDMYVLIDGKFVPKYSEGFHFQESNVNSMNELSSKIHKLIEQYEREHSTNS